MDNPYLSLLRKAWRYARHERHRFILVYAMFIVANIILALNPLFYGWFVNSLQVGGPEALANGWVYVVGFLLLRLAGMAIPRTSPRNGTFARVQHEPQFYGRPLQ